MKWTRSNFLLRPPSLAVLSPNLKLTLTCPHKFENLSSTMPADLRANPGLAAYAVVRSCTRSLMPNSFDWSEEAFARGVGV